MPLQAPSNYDTGTLHAHAGEATGDRSIHRTIVNEREVAARVGTVYRVIERAICRRPVENTRMPSLHWSVAGALAVIDGLPRLMNVALSGAEIGRTDEEHDRARSTRALALPGQHGTDICQDVSVEGVRHDRVGANVVCDGLVSSDAI